MKYWRGFLVAGIIAACTWWLTDFASANRTLIDMIFPYVSRMISGATAEWSAAVPFCMWQALLIFAVLAGCALITLGIVLKWNLLQISGWIAAAISLVVLLHSGIFGMNRFSGPMADDIHLKVTNYDTTELEKAAQYYLEEAIKAQDTLSVDASFPSFEDLAQMAPDGFRTLVYEEKLSVFAGANIPVKKLGWSGYYTGKGISGVTVNLTGEAAVNPNVPDILLPFAINHEMAHRISITHDQDANLAAVLACIYNENPYFIYSGYVNAYRYCLQALESLRSETAQAAVSRLSSLEGGRFTADIAAIDDFYKNSEDAEAFGATVTLLVSWHIQEIYLPDHVDNDSPAFDPMDESQVDLNGYVNDPAA